MHTEEQARKLWCPLRRLAPGDPADDRCLGSECMMWRDVPSDDSGWQRTGYCGLAGAPDHHCR